MRFIVFALLSVHAAELVRATGEEKVVSKSLARTAATAEESTNQLLVRQMDDSKSMESIEIDDSGSVHSNEESANLAREHDAANLEEDSLVEETEEDFGFDYEDPIYDDGLAESEWIEEDAYEYDDPDDEAPESLHKLDEREGVSTGAGGRCCCSNEKEKKVEFVCVVMKTGGGGGDTGSSMTGSSSGSNLTMSGSNNEMTPEGEGDEFEEESLLEKESYTSSFEPPNHGGKCDVYTVAKREGKNSIADQMDDMPEGTHIPHELAVKTRIPTKCQGSEKAATARAVANIGDQAEIKGPNIKGAQKWLKRHSEKCAVWKPKDGTHKRDNFANYRKIYEDKEKGKVPHVNLNGVIYKKWTGGRVSQLIEGQQVCTTHASFSYLDASDAPGKANAKQTKDANVAGNGTTEVKYKCKTMKKCQEMKMLHACGFHKKKGDLYIRVGKVGTCNSQEDLRRVRDTRTAEIEYAQTSGKFGAIGKFFDKKANSIKNWSKDKINKGMLKCQKGTYSNHDVGKKVFGKLPVFDASFTFYQQQFCDCKQMCG